MRIADTGLTLPRVAWTDTGKYFTYYRSDEDHRHHYVNYNVIVTL